MVGGNRLKTTEIPLNIEEDRGKEVGIMKNQLKLRCKMYKTVVKCVPQTGAVCHETSAYHSVRARPRDVG